jgi:hypothetical protein
VASKSWVSNPDYGHLPKQGKYQQQAPKQSKVFGSFRLVEVASLWGGFRRLVAQIAKNLPRVFQMPVGR